MTEEGHVGDKSLSDALEGKLLIQVMHIGKAALTGCIHTSAF